MLKIINIALGGALGAVCRYWISGFTYKTFTGGFPLRTLIINLTGALLIGLLWGVFEMVDIPVEIKIFAFVGLLGSFTTFSTFSLETFHLLRHGAYWCAFSSIMASVILGIALVFAGFFMSKLILGVLK